MQSQLAKLQSVYHEYPRPFWLFSVTVFIDRLGGSLLYPFFALYLTSRFKIDMAEVGGLFAAFAVSGFVGSALGGALADRLGRRTMLILSLIASSLSSVAMGLVGTVPLFVIVSVFVGILGNIGGPAQDAIVADLLPEEQRAQGYGIIRVVFNLAVVIGPVIGGFLATRSYLALFLTDAVISSIAAAFVYFFLPETKPTSRHEAKPESVAQTFAGYGRVLRDSLFMAFLLAVFLEVLVYMNMNTTLGVFLRDVHHVPESGYGWILSLNAAMVVVMQFWITRRLSKQKPMLMMAAGTALYAVGFAMYGLVSGYALFLLAMVVITIGEMVLAPFSQSLVASFAPEHMRGRYMAVSGLTWGLSLAIGPFLAGLVFDQFDPSWLWFACGIVGMISTLGFVLLARVHNVASVPVEPAAAD